MIVQGLKNSKYFTTLKVETLLATETTRNNQNIFLQRKDPL